MKYHLLQCIVICHVIGSHIFDIISPIHHLHIAEIRICVWLFFFSLPEESLIFPVFIFSAEKKNGFLFQSMFQPVYRFDPISSTEIRYIILGQLSVPSDFSLEWINSVRQNIDFQRNSFTFLRLCYTRRSIFHINWK